MMKTRHLVQVVILAAVLVVCTVGCTKRPSQEELAKLDQATAAADAAERKLADLRTERAQLEQQLEAKKQELGQHEAERDELKAKTGK
jgi:septal ring factor EnvC (AmiA/AmiB activator)